MQLHQRQRPNILVLNASRLGAQGNTHLLLSHAAAHLKRMARINVLSLADHDAAVVLEEIKKCDGLLIGTGTHWDSWSSTLQTFLEAATPTEGSSVWLGKPVGIIVTEHSVGGKGVLSRLQGVFATFGCLIPPMSGMVYSLAAQNSISAQKPGADDMWCLNDIKILTHNLVQGARFPIRWKAWPVDRNDFENVWIRTEASI